MFFCFFVCVFDFYEGQPRVGGYEKGTPPMRGSGGRGRGRGNYIPPYHMRGGGNSNRIHTQQQPRGRGNINDTSEIGTDRIHSENPNYNTNNQQRAGYRNTRGGLTRQHQHSIDGNVGTTVENQMSYHHRYGNREYSDDKLHENNMQYNNNSNRGNNLETGLLVFIFLLCV